MKDKKTKKLKFINENTMVVTLDIGKTAHYGYFRTPTGKEKAPFPVYNFRKSFHEFWRKICSFRDEHGLQEIVVGYESTGPYAEPLCRFLKSKNVKLVQVNPVHSKRLKELTDNSPNKTDKKDPRVIADIIALGHALTVVIPEGPAAEIRRLIKARERSLKNRTVFSNQLQHLVFTIFPEFLKVMKNNILSKSALYLLENYPTPASVLQASEGFLAVTLKKISRGRLGLQRSRELIEAAQASVGISEDINGIQMEIRHLLDLIENENRFIDTVEKEIEKLLQQIPYSASILSIKGIGKIIAAGLIGEVGNFKEFSTISEIMKLAGLDLYEISSGAHKGQRRISKRGRPLMRKLLFFAAVNMVKSKGIMHESYSRKTENGMPKIKALIAISRKILRLVFALARDDSIYEENYSVHKYKLAA